jgi:predicted metal-dependent enzyme (double-stranded beta helix superfamily)
MAYGLEDFVADCRRSLKTQPGPAATEEIRANLERLLVNEAFVKANCDDMDFGIHTLHEDKEHGFVVLSHVYENGRKSPPHDHGTSWAVYGQARHHTDMTIWRRSDGADNTEGAASIEIERTFRLEPPHAGKFDPGQIHHIDFPEGARFVRVTGTDLNRIETHRFDPEAGTIHTNRGVTAGAMAAGAMRSAS